MSDEILDSGLLVLSSVYHLDKTSPQNDDFSIQLDVRLTTFCYTTAHVTSIATIIEAGEIR